MKRTVQGFVRVGVSLGIAMCLTFTCARYCWSEGTLQELALRCKLDGDTYLHRGETGQAIRSYQKAIASDNKLTSAWFNMAIACYAIRDLDRAAFALRKLARIHPKDAEAHYNLGCLNLYRGNIREARREFETARNASPSEPFLIEQITNALTFVDLYENSSILQQHHIRLLLQDGLEPLTSA